MPAFEICSDIDICLQQLESSEQLAVAASRLHVHYVMSPVKIFCFEKTKNILNFSISIQINKNLPSSLIVNINNLIQRIVEAGFVSKWKAEFYTKKKNGLNPVKNLSLGQLMGAFLIIVIIEGLACVAAIIEHIIYYKANAPNAHRYWKCASHAVDGQRHLFIFGVNKSRK